MFVGCNCDLTFIFCTYRTCFIKFIAGLCLCYLLFFLIWSLQSTPSDHNPSLHAFCICMIYMFVIDYVVSVFFGFFYVSYFFFYNFIFLYVFFMLILYISFFSWYLWYLSRLSYLLFFIELLFF